MGKKTVADLDQIRNRVQAETTLKDGANEIRILVHMGTCGVASGADKVLAVVREEIARREVTSILVTTTGCAGLCSREPMLTVAHSGRPPVKYAQINEKKMRQIFEEHVVGGQPVKEFAIAQGCETTF
jgi:NADP-reducing hydrogenase subunit HndB